MSQKELLARLLETFLNEGYIGVEIGVDHADTTLCLLEQKKLGHLYAVDPYANREGRFKIISKLLGKQDKCTFIRDTSEGAANSLPDEMDFIFIDGDHSYKAVKSDLNNYVPKLKSGGLLTGHDWTSVRGNFGVVKAAEEFLVENEKLFHPLHTNESLINLGLPEFKRGGWSKKVNRHLIHKKRPSAFPLWWLIKR